MGGPSLTKMDVGASFLLPSLTPPSAPSLFPPLPLPLSVDIIGPCQLTDGGACATSPDYPLDYGISEQCTLSNVPMIPLEVIEFDVTYDRHHIYDLDGEDGGTCDFDYFKIGGVQYCGTSGPAGAVAEDGIILWVSNVPPGFGPSSSSSPASSTPLDPYIWISTDDSAHHKGVRRWKAQSA